MGRHTARRSAPLDVERAAPYARLSLAEKQALHRDRMREPAIACPGCETQIAVADATRHAASCPGRREPHPLSRWLTWKEVHRGRGVPKATLSLWVRTKRVRVRVEGGHRRFLEHDVSVELLKLRTKVHGGEPKEGQ